MTGTKKRAALNLNYSQMKITGVEEEEKKYGGCVVRERGHDQLIHNLLRRNFLNGKEVIVSRLYLLSMLYNMSYLLRLRFGHCVM